LRQKSDKDVMSLESTYRDLVSGQWKGPLAASLRGGLTVLEQPYRWIVKQRSLRFDHQHIQPHKVAAPVISVGNLTVGGTGKTPFVAWLARWFKARIVPVTVISRGYGSHSGRPNDEALELAAQLPDLPHFQNPDRVAAAEMALRANPRQVLILDDAFQHRRLARDLDIVLLDALAPFGYERLLPRGLLREPLASLARAHVIALSRSDAIEKTRREEIRKRCLSIAPSATWLELSHRPLQFLSSTGETMPLEALRGQSVAAFCGIGNPEAFRQTLASLGFSVSQWRELPDHCTYDDCKLRNLEQWLESAPVTHVLCTRKDQVKIPQHKLGGKRLWALEISLEIVSGRAELEQKLLELKP
jgi:tetraacyldisaccharide 4'-kinase